MKPTRSTVALALALVLVAPARAALGADFSGAWDTTYGRLELEQKGAAVQGSYDGGSATITGTVLETGRLTFRYEERTVRGEGWFELAADGAAFEGQWRPAGEEEWRAWQGKRLAPPAPLGFDGVFETTFGRMRLEADGAKVRGTYGFDGGSTIEGTVEGRRLTFRYKEPTAAGSGSFELSPDGDSFGGTWRADGSTQDSAWTGNCVKPDPSVRWLVVLEASWEESLAEDEYAFGDMLRAYFARLPAVRMRHRRVYDEADFMRATREIGYLAEPVVVVVAAHGDTDGVVLDSGKIGGKAIAASLAGAPNVSLLHFSSCAVMGGGLVDEILADLPASRALAVSGYAVPVDWAASAILEMLYLDFVLGRGIAPARAAEHVRGELACAKDKGAPGSPLGAACFRFVERKAAAERRKEDGRYTPPN